MEVSDQNERSWQRLLLRAWNKESLKEKVRGGCLRWEDIGSDHRSRREVSLFFYVLCVRVLRHVLSDSKESMSRSARAVFFRESTINCSRTLEGRKMNYRICRTKAHPSGGSPLAGCAVGVLPSVRQSGGPRTHGKIDRTDGCFRSRSDRPLREPRTIIRVLASILA